MTRSTKRSKLKRAMNRAKAYRDWGTFRELGKLYLASRKKAPKEGRIAVLHQSMNPYAWGYIPEILNPPGILLVNAV